MNGEGPSSPASGDSSSALPAAITPSITLIPIKQVSRESERKHFIFILSYDCTFHVRERDGCICARIGASDIAIYSCICANLISPEFLAVA